MTRLPDRPATPWVWLGPGRHGDSLSGGGRPPASGEILWSDAGRHDLFQLGPERSRRVADTFCQVYPARRRQQIPILYPWILSWVWRWNPLFPANLGDAPRITVVFGFAYVALAFSFLRRLRRIGSAEALLLTALLALQPDGPVLQRQPSIPTFPLLPWRSLHCSCGPRRRSPVLMGKRIRMQHSGRANHSASLLGVPIALGIMSAALARRAWKQAAIVASARPPLFCLAGLARGSFLAL